jgi:hypothetical protein
MWACLTFDIPVLLWSEAAIKAVLVDQPRTLVLQMPIISSKHVCELSDATTQRRGYIRMSLHGYCKCICHPVAVQLLLLSPADGP